MSRILKDAPRKIIENFTAEINKAKTPSPEPKKTVINFRDEHETKHARPIVTVPISLLRYRKDNGRIASDVLSYVKRVRPLDETEDEDQKILEEFLIKKDPDKTKTLKNAIYQRGQIEPAVITCDGFLINGNRRKMVLEMLREEHGSKFERMAVVILPGKDDPGGPPTIKEIEQIENRYQLQNDGKSEYANFDRAITIRRKINSGMSLEEQLKDDPDNASLSQREFKLVVRKYTEDFLEPLECVDAYLESLERDGYYSSISEYKGDPEGRWQAFIDYYKSVKKKLNSAKGRIEIGVNEDEVGELEDIAFNLIRFREIKGKKLHALMREFPKFLKNPMAKNELFELNKKIKDLDEDDTKDVDGTDIDYDVLDQKWRKKNQTQIHNSITKIISYTEHGKEMETPIDLLEQAYKKLVHEKMDPKAVAYKDLKKAMQLAADVKNQADDLESKFYKGLKSFDNLEAKFKGKK